MCPSSKFFYFPRNQINLYPILTKLKYNVKAKSFLFDRWFQYRMMEELTFFSFTWVPFNLQKSMSRICLLRYIDCDCKTRTSLRRLFKIWAKLNIFSFSPQDFYIERILHGGEKILILCSSGKNEIYFSFLFVRAVLTTCICMLFNFRFPEYICAFGNKIYCSS